MSVLNTLQVAESGERTKGYDPIRVRRKKLAAGVQEQINLIASEGGAYRRVQIQRKRDLESDELFEVEQRRRVGPWWWVDDDGLVRFSLRYGSTKLKIKDGKDAIVLQTMQELAALLPNLRMEILTGGLDDALAQAANALEARFKARKKAVKGA